MDNDSTKRQLEKERYADELIEFAREYHSSDFHDVDRRQCPAPNTLSKIIRSGSFPDEEMRTHLLACSACFQEFRSLKEEFSAESAAGVSRLIRRAVFHRVGALVASAAAVILMVGLSYFFMFGDRTADRPAVEVALDAPASVRSEPLAPEQLQKGTDVRSETNINSKTEAKQIPTIGLDLARLAVSRNSSDDSALTRIPAANIRLRIDLRPGSQAGEYRLALLDEFGKTLLSPIFVRSSGRTVSAVMDLTRHVGPSRLCVFYGDEIPDCIPLEVTSPK